MKYRIKVTRRFENDFARSEKTLKERIIKRIEGLKSDLYSSKALHGGWFRRYTLRLKTGDHRVRDEIFL